MNEVRNERNELNAPSGSALEVGDYVIATKYGDGDPQDHWCVGFYAGVTAPHYDPPRYDVVDAEGNQFRGNGFRRVEKIEAKAGRWMLDNARDIEFSGMSVWDILSQNAEIAHSEQTNKG